MPSFLGVGNGVCHCGCLPWLPSAYCGRPPRGKLVARGSRECMLRLSWRAVAVVAQPTPDQTGQGSAQ